MKSKSNKQNLTLASLIFITAIGFSSSSWAWTNVSNSEQTYKFQFNLNGEVFKDERKASSYEEAFDKAAQNCFNHFKTQKKLTEERGLDIIDACANPRLAKN